MTHFFRTSLARLFGLASLFCWHGISQAQTPPKLEGTTSERVIRELGMTLVPIQPGMFKMGWEGRHPSEMPVTEVTISRPFWMGKTEVTNAQWFKVTGERELSHLAGKGDYPAVGMSWEDAVMFCCKLNQDFPTPPGYEYRLPTEAEWEYACRDDDSRKYLEPFNIPNPPDDEPSSHTSTRGLIGMMWNAYEWCFDWYGPYPGGKVKDPLGPQSGEERIFRGGAMGFSSDAGPVPYGRNWIGPILSHGSLGFRVVLAPKITLKIPLVNRWKPVGIMENLSEPRLQFRGEAKEQEDWAIQLKPEDADAFLPIGRKVWLDEAGIQRAQLVERPGGAKKVVLEFTPEGTRKYWEATVALKGRRMLVLCESQPMVSFVVTEEAKSATLELPGNLSPELVQKLLSLCPAPKAK